MQGERERGRVVAVLGPTNTGKTHLAIERMLGHATGIIGFPLRLLARENYDRIAKKEGAAHVALLTGEEKIIPAHPRWTVCTVESMPTDRKVDFLAVDEIQLCADPERGHVFTDRLLHARGTVETMFLGADTIRPLLQRLVPEAEYVARPRFSKLSYSGPKKPTRLPRRSAVVAFSAAEVYALAELLRRQTGGAAVVLGALSPRTRNAQVAMFQAGEVDYLVATDAIGMGLNMEIDHVAFAGLSKFDGRGPRPLAASEVGQIGGRAGRYMNDGTFGTTGDLAGLDPDLVNAVETHAFPSIRRLSWRNTDLRFTSVEALVKSLERYPDHPGLIRAREADDQLALKTLAADPELLGLARGPDRVKLLWEVCRIPDFRKSLAEQHARLLAQLFRHLTGPTHRLPEDWLDAQLKRLERTDGDIDTLMTRIANVRTWTYVSHRTDWMDDAVAWQVRARALEDKLSDALHERLTQRFVDKRTTVLMRGLRDGSVLKPSVQTSGEVLVEGQQVGRLDGFRFRADTAQSANGARVMAAAAQRALAPEIARRVGALVRAEDPAFAADKRGFLLWEEAPVARLVKGVEMLRPRIEVLASDLISPADREVMRRRLETWLEAHVEGLLGPLFALRREALAGPARGLAFQLGERLGTLPKGEVEALVSALSGEDRKALDALGVRLGTESVFIPALLKGPQRELRALLWAVAREQGLVELPSARRVYLKPGTDLPRGLPEAIGYVRVANKLVRADALERFAAEARRLARKSPFAPSPALPGLIQAPMSEAFALLEALGYRREGGAATFAPAPVRTPSPAQIRPTIRRDSPFAVLGRLA